MAKEGRWVVRKGRWVFERWEDLEPPEPRSPEGAPKISVEQLDTRIEQIKAEHEARVTGAGPTAQGATAGSTLKKAAGLPGRYFSWVEQKNREIAEAEARARAAAPPQPAPMQGQPQPQAPPEQGMDPFEMASTFFGGGFAGMGPQPPPQRPPVMRPPPQPQRGKKKGKKQPEPQQVPREEPQERPPTPEEAMANMDRLMRNIFS